MIKRGNRRLRTWRAQLLWIVTILGYFVVVGVWFLAVWPGATLGGHAYYWLVISIAGSCGLLFWWAVTHLVLFRRAFGQSSSGKQARSYDRGGWGLFGILVLSAAHCELYVLMTLSAVPSGSAYIATVAIVLSLLIGAALALMGLILKSSATIPRILAFLAIQAMVIFTFSQIYLYGGMEDSDWDVDTAVLAAKNIVSGSRDALIDYIFESSGEKLYGLIAYYRSSFDEAVRKRIVDVVLFVDGKCERTNFGAAMYFSTITWTSVGFGDFRPAPWSQGAAAVESALGYIFMALTAAIVLRWLGPGRGSREGCESSVRVGANSGDVYHDS